MTTSYTYDNIDQLLSESRSGYSASYSYDANGNRLTKTLGGSTDSYSYDDADKLSSITNGGSTVKSYGYDSAGRTTSVTTSGGTKTLAYDYEGRVSSITYPSSATNTFAYNGLDTRVSKVDSAGTATYKRDGAGVTAPVLSDSSAVYTPGISERRSSTTKFYGADRLGTNSLETNSSQTVTSTKTYDAFGMLQASTGSSASPFGFAGAHGYQEDGDSGLKLLGHRYYDASTGRFITRDPLMDGRNWYSYCGNNPIRRYDSTGGFWKEVLGGVVCIAATIILAPLEVPVIAGVVLIGGYTVVASAIGAQIDGTELTGTDVATSFGGAIVPEFPTAILTLISILPFQAIIDSIYPNELPADPRPSKPPSSGGGNRWWLRWRWQHRCTGHRWW